MQRAKPFQTQISRYVRQELQADLVAALTVAMVAIPQGMSYAAIAGVNPIHGLYTAIVPAIVGALLGSSSHLITGPTNATALATAGVLLGFAGRPDYVELVFAVAVITGLVRLLLGLLQLGGIIRYVSSSVLTGFLAGAGVLIILNQLHTALGLARPVGASAGALLLDLLGRLHKLNPYVAATTCLSAAVLITGPRIQRRLPRALLAIFLAALWVQAAGWEARGVLLVKDLRSVTRAQFGFHVPDLPVRLWGELLASSGAVALLSLVEAMSIANIIALASNERIKPSREFVGQGVASLVGGFFQCIPSSGSLARSAVAYNSGGRTRVTALLSGVLVLLAVVSLWPWLGLIPMAALSAVVVLSAASLVDYRHLRVTWESRATSRVVLATTWVATLLLPLHLAIFLGTVLSIALYLHESSNVRLTYLTVGEDGSFVEHGLDRFLGEQPAIALINLEGVLYFAAAEDLEGKLLSLLQTGVKVVVLRVRRLRLLAGSGVTALQRTIGQASQLGVTVLICGITEEARDFLESSGLRAAAGTDRTFEAQEALFASTRQALRRAHEIVSAEEAHESNLGEGNGHA